MSKKKKRNLNDTINEIIITARKITPRRVQGVLTGFRISIPAAFSAYIDTSKKYDVILKPVKEES